MDTFSTGNGRNRKELTKAFVVEAVFVGVLALIVLFTLNYFKIIDLSSVFPQKNNTVVSNTVPTPAISKTNSLKEVRNITSDAFQDTFAVINRNKGVDFSFYSSQYRGIIKSVEEKKGIIPGTNLPYALVFTLGFENSTDEVKLYYPQESIDKISVYDKAGAGGASGSAIALFDLKSGDKVILKDNFDFMKKYPYNLNSLEIIKR